MGELPPSFRFRALPPELRIKVYRYLHVSYEAIVLTRYGSSRDYQCRSFLSAAMLRTCREIYHESSAILFGENEFVIEASADAARLRLGLSGTSALRDQISPQMCPSVLLPPSRLRNIRIAITLKCKSDYSTTSVILHEACSWLQQIQRLSLVLELQLFPGMERYFCILEPLMSLREVHKFSMRHNNNSYDTTSLIKQNLLSSKLGCKHGPNIQPSGPVGAPSDYTRYL